MFTKIIIGVIILTLIYTVVFKKALDDTPNLNTYIRYLFGAVPLATGIVLYKYDDGFFYYYALIFIGLGLFGLWAVLDDTYNAYKVKKNTAKVVERFVTGIVKTKNSTTNIRTVNNNVKSSEEYHTVIKLDSPDNHDNFINFYDYNTFMTVSEGERVNLKNIRKFDKNDNLLDSTYWIV